MAAVAEQSRVEAAIRAAGLQEAASGGALSSASTGVAAEAEAAEAAPAAAAGSQASGGEEEDAALAGQLSAMSLVPDSSDTPLAAAAHLQAQSHSITAPDVESLLTGVRNLQEAGSQTGTAGSHRDADRCQAECTGSHRESAAVAKAVAPEVCGSPASRMVGQKPPEATRSSQETIVTDSVSPDPAGGATSRVAGLEDALQALRELVGWPSLYAREGAELGVRWPRGLLLHGPPGCGKTLLVAAVAAEYGAVLHTITASDVVGAYVGESERRLRDAFEAAKADARAGRTAIIFLDEADALCPRRDGSRPHEARMVAQLLTLMDGADSEAGGRGRDSLRGGTSSGREGCGRAGQGGELAGGSDRSQDQQGCSSSGGGSGPSPPPQPAGALVLQEAGGEAPYGPSTPLGGHREEYGEAFQPASSAAAAFGTPPGSRWEAALPSQSASRAATALRAPLGGRWVVVAATNRPNAIDVALRRPGRLDREVLVPVPGVAGREAILRLHTSGLRLSPNLDLVKLAESCHGYSGADLAALAREAAMHALADTARLMMLAQPGQRRQQQRGGLWEPWPLGQQPGQPGQPGRQGQLGKQGQQEGYGQQQGQQEGSGAGLGPGPVGGVLLASDFAAAMKRVGPSIVRGAQVELPPVRWEDVGGLPEVKRRLRQAVEWPLRHRDAFSRLGLKPPRGVLLYGPPGCSKTTMARAAASASRATLLPLSCAQLFSMYAGEGEALLRDVFMRARLAAPSIIFLDEVDSVAARRSESSESGPGAGDASSLRLLSALLTEMDGMELATGVLVLAATNRPAAIDAALMRPGRLDVQLYVPPPDGSGRLEVLRVHTSAMPLEEDVDLELLASSTNYFSGAELAGLCREAAIAALREDLDGATHVAARHFDAALKAAKQPTMTPGLLRQYEAWQAGGPRTRAGAAAPSAGVGATAAGAREGLG